MFDSVRRDFERTCDAAESTVNNALSDVSSAYWDDDDFLRSAEDGEDYDEQRMERIARKIEKIFQDTLDAVVSDFEEYGVDVSDIHSDVRDAFDEAIRDDDWDVLADTVSLDSYY